MSDLADLAADVAKDLPAQIRKVIDAAIANGWELNPPGMTLALRLNHPTDDLAQPVYITWNVGRTPKGSLSFRFNSCGTRGLVKLSGADLLEYLEDPTVAYMTDDDIAEADAKAQEKEDRKRPEWDPKADVVTNLHNRLGAQIVEVRKTTAADLMAEQRAKLSTPSAPTTTPSVTSPSPVKAEGAPLRVAAPPLRIKAPKA